MNTEKRKSMTYRVSNIWNRNYPTLFIIGLFIAFTVSYTLTQSLVYPSVEPYADWDTTVLEGFEDTLFCDIEFLNVTHGWLAGTYNRGVILHSNDGGITWTIQYEHDDHDFRSLSIIGPDNIWAGAGGKLFHSTDCGDSWSIININVIGPLNVEFYNDSYGYAGGYAGLFVTIDSGLTWEERSSWPDETFPNDISITPSIIRVATNDGIYLSNDTGTTWKLESTKQTRAISFVEDTIVWAAHYNTISNFDGNAWNEMEGVSEQMNYAAPSIWDIEFLDANIGWTAGRSPAIAHTIDGGKTWYHHVTMDMHLKAIEVYNESHCWVSGWEGVVARTTTGNLFGPKLIRGYYLGGWGFGSGGRTIPYEPFYVAMCVTLAFGIFSIYKRTKWCKSQLNILHPPSIE